MLRPRFVTLCLPAVALAAALPAQLVRGGDLVVADYGLPGVFRVEPNGTITQLPDGGLLGGPSGIAVTRLGEIAVTDFPANSLVLIPPLGAPRVVASGLRSPIRVAEDVDGTFLVASLGNNAVLRVTRGGQVTTVAPMPSGSRPFGVTPDPRGNGEFLVVDDRADTLFRVDPLGNVTPLHAGLPFQLPQGAAFFANGDYAVFDGVTDSIFRVDRSSNAVTTWVTNGALAANPEGIVPSGDGGFFVSSSGNPGGNRVLAIDPAGNVSTVGSGAPLVNVEDIGIVPSLRAPAFAATGPGNPTTFVLDLRAEANRTYALGIAATVFPGLQLSPTDPRGLTVNPDALFVTTLGLVAPPVFTGFFGVLDPTGQSSATLDLSILPPGALAGIVLHAQALTFDLAAPTGIGDLTDALPITFR
ncbi:MAG: hypothetical protein IPM29_15815 [Planctomycetes bacterium]|nr:hypothetical protein [Planctomycetota bacterium]